MKIEMLKKTQIEIDEKYNVRKFEPTKQLTNSLKNGIITPVIVVKEEDSFVLIDGFRRVQLSNSDDIDVYIFNDLKKCFLKSIEVNSAIFPYSEIEKAYVLNTALNFCGFTKEEVIKEIHPLLGLGKKIEVLNLFLSVLTLEKRLFNFLLSKKAPVSLFAQFLSETDENQLALCKFFEEKRLSVSQLKKTYDLIFYIRKRENVELSSILKDVETKTDFENCLVKRRFPEFSQLKSKIVDLIKDYKGNLSFPEDLEETHVSFTARLRDLKDIEKAVLLLEKLKKDKRFTDFIKYL